MITCPKCKSDVPDPKGTDCEWCGEKLWSGPAMSVVVTVNGQTVLSIADGLPIAAQNISEHEKDVRQAADQMLGWLDGTDATKLD